MQSPCADEDKSIQTLLRIVLNVTMILSLIIRMMTAGWVLIILGIPLLIVMSLHAGFLKEAIKKIPETKPLYSYLIVISNLFFFIGFTLQVDYGDAPTAHVPILFGVSFRAESNWPGIFSTISVGSFVALVLSWILLLTLSKSVLKKEKPA
jgi:hypothetical protein